MENFEMNDQEKIKKLQQRIKVLEKLLLEEVLKNDLLCQGLLMATRCPDSKRGIALKN